MKPIILDRSRLEQYATCPRQGYLSVLRDAVKAKTEGFEVYDWEKARVENADAGLIDGMSKIALQSATGRLAECGTQIHDLIDRAFTACNNDTSLVPEWFVDNLPSIKPNIQPMAIRHAKHVADMVSEHHVAVIGLELQISLVIIPETETAPAVIGTSRLDLLGSGKGNLHVVDWKTGFKRRSNSETVDSFQAQFIALLLFNQAEYKEINTIHFWYYETMWGTKSHARFDRNDEHPRLPGLTTEVALRGRATEAVKLFQMDCRDAWPLPDACCWCDMIRFCPQASIEAKEIADDPKAFIDNLVVLEALCGIRKKAATAWIKAKGAIEGTKVVFSKKVPQERFTAGFEDKAVSKLTELENPELNNHFK